MPFTGPLEDRIAIRELYDAYADASFRGDRAAYLALWHDDGVRAARQGEARGKAELAAHWDQSWAMLTSMTFFTQISAIEVDGDRATARCYCLERLNLKAGIQTDVVGNYADQLIRADGRWLFLRKEYSLHMFDPESPLFKGR